MSHQNYPLADYLTLAIYRSYTNPNQVVTTLPSSTMERVGDIVLEAIPGRIWLEDIKKLCHGVNGSEK